MNRLGSYWLHFIPPVPLGIRTQPYNQPNGWDSLIDGGTVGLLKKA